MKFKDTTIGDRLTVWQLSQRHYVLKISEDTVVNLLNGEILHIHKNKDVEPAERLTPDYQIGIVGGEVVALRKLDSNHFELVNIVRIGGRIVSVGEVKLMEKNQMEKHECNCCGVDASLLYEVDGLALCNKCIEEREQAISDVNPYSYNEPDLEADYWKAPGQDCSGDNIELKREYGAGTYTV
jgi:hypothetical protein